MQVNSIAVMNSNGSQKMAFGNSSNAQAAVKADVAGAFVSTVPGRAKQVSSPLSRFLKVAVLAGGTLFGTAACNKADDIVKPNPKPEVPVVVEPVVVKAERALAPVTQYVMASGTDKNIPQESLIHDSATGKDTFYKHLGTKGDTVNYYRATISGKDTVGRGISKFVTDANGVTTAVNSYSSGNFFNDPNQIIASKIKYVKEGGTVAATMNEIKNATYSVVDEKTVRRVTSLGEESFLTNLRLLLKPLVNLAK